MPERQAPAQPIPVPSPMPRTESAGSAAEAVAEILACADVAVGAIGREAEARVREMTARVEARPAEEAAMRRAQLETLRGELAERAAALALSYGSILEELGAIDRMLAGETSEPEDGRRDAEEDDPRLAAIKMTLRERRRIHVPTEEAVPPAAPWAEQADGGTVTQETSREVWPAQTAEQWQAPPAPTEAWPPAAPEQVWVQPPMPAPGLGVDEAPAVPQEPPRRPRRWWQRAA